MPPRSNEFQAMIAAIEAALAPYGAKVTESKMVPERHSGRLREIDVAIDSSVGSHEVMIGIECRDHQRTSDVEWLDQIIGKYLNLDVHKIVAVSKSGFTEGAHVKAKEHGVETRTVAEVTQAELIPITQKRTIHVENCIPTVTETKVHFLCEMDDQIRAAIGPILETTVIDIDNQPIAAFGEYGQALLDKASPPSFIVNPRPIENNTLPPVELKIPPDTYVLGADGIKRPLDWLIVDRTLDVYETELQLDAFNYLNMELLAGKTVLSGYELRILLLYDEQQNQTLRVSAIRQ